MSFKPTKLIAALSAFVMCAVAFTESYPEGLAAITADATTQSIPGDILADGHIDAKDILLMKRALLKKETLPADVADFNSDGVADATDLYLLQNFLHGQYNLDDLIAAFGAYDAEAAGIKISWVTNASATSFDILCSDDNTEFTKVATVKDATEYLYPVTEEFDSKYFAVCFTNEDGELIKSASFNISKGEDGYEVEFTDTDDDGVMDVIEQLYGTDVTNADTDKDGLTDYQEIYITRTDPLVSDSVEKGAADSEADSDGDSLTSSEEIKLGTNPKSADSDDDGLTDAQETKEYSTKPLVSDTDEDGLSDGAEIRMGLDPLSAATNGVPDSECRVEQTISGDSKVLSRVNTEESPYAMSVKLTTNGDAEKLVAVSESGYSNVVKNDAQIGTCLELSFADTCTPENVTLEFAVKDKYTANTLNKYSAVEDMQGIQRLNVFKYCEEVNMLLPIETKYDTEKNLVYADVDSAGSYCVMDLEIWFDLLGLTPEEAGLVSEDAEAKQSRPAQQTPAFPELPYVKKDFNGHEYAIIEHTNLSWEDACDYCENLGGHLATITSAEEQEFLNGLLENGKNNLYWIGGTKRDNKWAWITAETFSFSYWAQGEPTPIVEENYLQAYGPIINDGLLTGLWNNTPVYNNYDGNELALKYRTLNCAIICEWDDCKIVPTEYDAIIGSSFKTVTLKSILNWFNNVDTDNDGLSDWNEAINKYLQKETLYGTVTLPTIGEISKILDMDILLSPAGNDTSAKSAMFSAISSKQVLPCYSDPTIPDSDGDGLTDNTDFEPLVSMDNRFMLIDETNYSNIVPTIGWTDIHIKQGEKCSNSNNSIFACGKAVFVFDFFELLAEVGFTYPALPAFIALNDLIDAGDLLEDFELLPSVKFSEFIEWYLYGDGCTKYLTSDEMYSLIQSSKANRQHYSNNLNELKNVAEEMIDTSNEQDDKIYISTSPTALFKAACYKGNYCNGISHNKYDDATALDWGYAVGEALCAMTAEVYKSGEKYCMKVKYYIVDNYEFAYHWEEFDGNIAWFDENGHFLHEVGLAQEYKIIGLYEDFVTWEEGEILYPDDYARISLEENKYNAGPYR